MMTYFNSKDIARASDYLKSFCKLDKYQHLEEMHPDVKLPRPGTMTDADQDLMHDKSHKLHKFVHVHVESR